MDVPSEEFPPLTLPAVSGGLLTRSQPNISSSSGKGSVSNALVLRCPVIVLNLLYENVGNFSRERLTFFLAMWLILFFAKFFPKGFIFPDERFRAFSTPPNNNDSTLVDCFSADLIALSSRIGGLPEMKYL